MIISKTPFRISLFGGGTDYPSWYRDNGGSVLATAIDKYCYISCRHLPPFFEHKHRIVYGKVESVKKLKKSNTLLSVLYCLLSERERDLKFTIMETSLHVQEWGQVPHSP